MILTQFSSLFSGEKSRDPSEACLNYYFDEEKSPLMTLIQNGGHNRKPCPFSGRYSVYGDLDVLTEFMDPSGLTSACPASGQSTVMHAGCSQHSSDLRIQHTCRERGKSGFKKDRTEEIEIDLNNDYVCHGSWHRYEDSAIDAPVAVIDDNYLDAKRRRQTRQQRHRTDVLILSTKSAKTKKFLCLTYTELDDGVLSAFAGPEACNYTLDSGGSSTSTLPLLSDSLSLSLSTSAYASSIRPVAPLGGKSFNISSSGPCLQALTSSSCPPRSLQPVVLLVIAAFAFLRH